MLKYTDPSLVEDMQRTDAPMYGRAASGYGSKIPTEYMVRYEGRARRVYVMQYSDAGSAYIIVNGKGTFLDSDTEHRLMALPY